MVDVIATLLLLILHRQMLCLVVLHHLLLQECIEYDMADVIAIYLLLRLVLLPLFFSWLMLLPFVCC